MYIYIYIYIYVYCRTGRGPLAIPFPPPTKETPRPSRAAKQGAMPFMATNTDTRIRTGATQALAVLHLSHTFRDDGVSHIE